MKHTLEPMRDEWTIWRRLCQELERAGAVTSADLNSPASALNTNGQKLLELIRQWGASLVALNAANQAAAKSTETDVCTDCASKR